jgi:hypothetical protein
MDGKYTAAMATGAALASALTLSKQTQAAAATAGIPPELIELIAAMAADLAVTKQALIELLAKLSVSGGAYQGWPPNTNQIVTARYPIAVALQAIQLDDIPIPDDFELIIKADPTNPVAPQRLLVGNSRANAENVNAAWPLLPNEFRGFKVKSARVIWVAATAVPAWVNISVEQPGG